MFHSSDECIYLQYNIIVISINSFFTIEYEQSCVACYMQKEGRKEKKKIAVDHAKGRSTNYKHIQYIKSQQPQWLRNISIPALYA